MRLLLIVHLLFATAATAHAASLEVGDRVRVTTVANETTVGRLTIANDSVLVLTISEQTRMAPAIEQAIPRRTIALIERSDGLDSKTRKGAVIGGSLGVVTGVIVGYLAAMGAENITPLYVMPPTLAVTGALAGAAIAGAANGERWTEVSYDSHVGLTTIHPPTPETTAVVRVSRSRTPRASHGVRVGDRIRLTTAAMPKWPIVGRVVAVDDSQLTIAVVRTKDEDYGLEHTFDWEAIERIDRSTGWQSRSAKGALVGAGTGLLVGGTSFLIGVPAPPLAAGFTYGVVGSLIGASIGASKRTETWTTVLQATPPPPTAPEHRAANTLEVGDRVRLNAPSLNSEPIIGQIVSSNDEQITLATAPPKGHEPAPQRTIDWDALRGIERSKGFQSKVGKGMLVGAGFGAAVGIGAALAGANDTRTLIQAPLLLGGAGAIAGAAIGGIRSGEEWSTIPLETRVTTPEPVPTSNGVLASNKAVDGALIGAGVGLLAGFALTAANTHGSEEATSLGLILCPIGVGAGMLIGAGVGSTMSSQSAALPALENAKVGVTLGPENVPMLAIRTTF